MRRSIRWSRGRGLACCAFLCAGLIAAQSAAAGPNDRTKSESSGSQGREQIQTPMTSKGAGVAPYSVRLRITGFLARQHARDGDTHRALVEYHSMLNVDDPVWPDSEEGDSMRIARDIEVAQMMSESGFYDHAIRVLQTSLILARVNKDPQAAVVERQMLATTELAQIKGVAVPSPDMSYADVDVRSTQPDPVAPLHEGPVLTGKPAVSESSELKADVADEVAQSSMPIPSMPREFPQSTTSRTEPSHAAPPQVYSEKKSEDKFRLSKLLPSRRWRNRDASVEADPVVTDAQPRPLTSPDVSPTYCPECSGLHGRTITHSGVAASSPWGTTQGQTVVQSTSPAEPYSHQSVKPVPGGEGEIKEPSLLSRMLGKKRFGNALETSPVDSNSSRTAGPSLEPPAVAEPLVLKSTPSAGSEPELTLTQLEGHSSRKATTGEPSEAAVKDDGPALQPQSLPEPDDLNETEQKPAREPESLPEPGDSNETVQKPDREPATSKLYPQVGVAGQIAKPGIFTFEGTSTTLAALMRRTGEDSNASIKRTRILRSVDLQRGSNSADQLRDFYCQRLEVVQLVGNEVDTPIYGQELVIVDGAGQKPIYVAVMPQFILQIPANTGHPVTADQVVDQLRVYWPNIRGQEIGLVRFEQWSRASKIARIDDADESAESPLNGGDVLYVDGLNLDRSQVLSAAEAIARLAGAKIRLPESGVRQTAGASK